MNILNLVFIIGYKIKALLQIFFVNNVVDAMLTDQRGQLVL